MRALQDCVAEYAASNPRIPAELVSHIRTLDNPNRLVDQAMAIIPNRINEKAPVFSMTDTAERLRTATTILETEREVAGIRNAVVDRVKKKMDQGQREYFLNEQIKELRRELGREDADENGIANLEVRFKARRFPKAAARAFTTELRRLGRLGPGSPEAGTIRTYLETILDLPWPEPDSEQLPEKLPADDTASDTAVDATDPAGIASDPAAALLEVLDPEQNRNFQDHYLEIDYDLSRVCFICTANSLQSVPFPLLDRLEVISIPGYAEHEKVEIARNFLVPRQLRECGLDDSTLELSDRLLAQLVRNYSFESDVRSLEKQLGKLFRKLARLRLEAGSPETAKKLNQADLRTHLGPPKHRQHDFQGTNPGTAFGLAWTELGGHLLPGETLVYPGEAQLHFTGNLGDVMRESARIALSTGDAILRKLGASDPTSQVVHIHAPEGGVPKDGPSAGITILVYYISAVLGRAPDRRLAMTGELTLSGSVLPVGGIREKVLAAVCSGFGEILLPAGNRDDYENLEARVLSKLKVRFVKNITELMETVFPGLT